MAADPPPVVTEPGADAGAAQALAARLGVEAANEPPASGLYLACGPDGLALCRAGRPPTRLRPDFVHGPQGFRRVRLSARREALARACRLHRRPGLNIVDATAGLGRDGFVLAALGARVTLLEHSPVVAALLEDALLRARADPSTRATAERMVLITTDAVPWLRQLPEHRHPEVVTLDPMYAGSRRGAAGKTLALLQALLGPPDDPAPLLQAALSAARERVVVKRHRHAPPLADRKPDHAIQGRSTRFDVYGAKRLLSEPL
ncbi:class I SAM-dependent methyltransferase [Spiribacter halobius]|uniref:Ribosomal RNA small subunit methyltransferase J n=1 Tax=Sediminicurvatus halobius TaxID=2182432 RepID=A0A2U2N275_9GAMM|nr:class I SAM-dependent methyltransferase [Spiribacter halobius]PWG63079.1 rRNA methyltransferase [Spiribacter halobius]UEX77527.1 class I SAM-dependent methyltransferase [Spiribacter halobius]